MTNDQIYRLKNRLTTDVLLTASMLIATQNSSSLAVEIYPRVAEYGALVIPMFNAYNADGALERETEARQPIGITITSQKTQTQFIPDPTDIYLLNEYFLNPGAKPIVMGPGDHLIVTASQINAGYTGGTFSAITVNMLCVVQYITKAEYDVIFKTLLNQLA